MTRLLHKITELEHNVTTDVRNDVFAKGKDVRDNDTYSEAQSNFDRQSSVNSFRPKLGRDILKKIKNKGRKPKFWLIPHWEPLKLYEQAKPDGFRGGIWKFS